jgi:two-component system chemotaxis response regulator CheB
MASRNIVVVGGSAGALDSLVKLLRNLPQGFPAAILVAVHTAPENTGHLSMILARAGKLPAETATDGSVIQVGRVYVAPPDHHLLVKDGTLRVTRGPRENGFRPALDPLYRTAAAAYGSGVIAIILSGGGDDGILGLSMVKRRGGTIIVQDPDEAAAPSMPSRAIHAIEVDHTLRAEDMASIVSGLVRQAAGEAPSPPLRAVGADVAEAGTDALDSGLLPGPPTAFTCPQCSGALWEVRDGDLVRYQCHVGHAFSPDSLAAGQADDLEQALWTALRTLEESSTLRRRMAQHAREHGMNAIAEAYEEHALDSESRAKLLRRVITAPADVKVESS